MSESVRVVRTRDDFCEVFEQLKASPTLAIDSETVGNESLYWWNLANSMDQQAARKREAYLKFEKVYDAIYRGRRYKPDRAKHWSAVIPKLNRLWTRYPDKGTLGRDLLDRWYADFKAWGDKKHNPGAQYLETLKKKMTRVETAREAFNRKATNNKSGLHFWENQLAAIQIATDIGEVFLIRPSALDPKEFETLLNTRIMVIAHNLAFDWKMFKHHLGVHMHCENVHDSYIAEFLITNGSPDRVGLAPTLERRYDKKLDKSVRVSNWLEEWDDTLQSYMIDDVVDLHRLALDQREELAQMQLEQVYNLERALIPVTGQMDLEGLGIDRERASGLKEQLEVERTTRRAAVRELLGPINPDSPKQLLEALQGLDIKVTSTASKALLRHKGRPEVQAILSYRKVGKLLSTYLEPFLQKTVPQEVDGEVHHRIFGNFRQCGPETGRYSSDDPNLQNLPSTAEFRGLFIPRPGYIFINADLSSIEPRILAELTQDPALLHAFNTGEDVYKHCASLMFAKSIDMVTPDDRATAKALFLGIIYGKSKYGLAEDLSCDPWDAEILIHKFFWGLIHTETWVHQQKLEASHKRHIRTLGGRIRRLEDAASEDKKLRARAERQIVNSIIQGSAADAFKLGLLFLSQEIKRLGLDARVVGVVHDEILVECRAHPEIVRQVREVVRTSIIRGTEQFVRSVPVQIGDAESNWEALVITDWGKAKEKPVRQALELVAA